jgi:hypothetical protein
MKGEILYKILNSLTDRVIDSADFTHAILKAGYGASSGKINSEFSKIQSARILSDSYKKELQKLKIYIAKLKSQGLILENTSGQISLSSKGKKKLTSFQNSPSLNKDIYRLVKNGRVTVISYDIPVAFNRERNMLRDMLRMLDFRLIHKSVWVGTGGVPEKFLADLQRLKIMNYVEILEVTKSGTLKSKN